MTTKTASPVNAPADRVLVLTRVFDAPRPLVFEAWTKKEHLDRWSCPSGFRMERSHGDLRPGGEFGFSMIAPNGEKHEATGVYREIVPNELLVMTHGWLEDDGSRPWETVLTVRFEDEGGKTKLTLEQSVFRSVESRDGHHGGWSQCFDKLGELLAELKTKEKIMTTELKKATEDYLGREFVITREFAAPRELVFEAWRDAKHVAQWWGPRGFTNPVCQWKAVKGQAIHVVMRAPDGTDYPMGGEFREIVAPERLVISCGALNEKGEMLFEFVHAVSFAEQGCRTTVTVKSRVTRTTAEANRYIGGFEAGMTQSLARLGEMLDRAGAEAMSSTASEREIVISRVFAAPRELVWDAMTDPKQVVKWWGPRGFTTTIEEMNVRPGGVWNHMMHGPDGTDYPNRSIFTEVVKPERIVYTHGGGKKGEPGVHFVMTWTFDAVEAGKTRLTVRQVYATAEDRDRIVREFGAVEGGKQTLARLAEYLVAGP